MAFKAKELLIYKSGNARVKESFLCIISFYLVQVIYERDFCMCHSLFSPVFSARSLSISSPIVFFLHGLSRLCNILVKVPSLNSHPIHLIQFVSFVFRFPICSSFLIPSIALPAQFSLSTSFILS